MHLSSQSSGSTFSLPRLHYKVATLEPELREYGSPKTNRGPRNPKTGFSQGTHLVFAGGGGGVSIRGKGLTKPKQRTGFYLEALPLEQMEKAHCGTSSIILKLRALGEITPWCCPNNKGHGPFSASLCNSDRQILPHSQCPASRATLRGSRGISRCNSCGRSACRDQTFLHRKIESTQSTHFHATHTHTHTLTLGFGASSSSILKPRALGEFTPWCCPDDKGHGSFSASLRNSDRQIWVWAVFPLTRVPFWYRVFEPQPYCPTASVLPRAQPCVARAASLAAIPAAALPAVIQRSYIGRLSPPSPPIFTPRTHTHTDPRFWGIQLYHFETTLSWAIHSLVLPR